MNELIPNEITPKEAREELSDTKADKNPVLEENGNKKLKFGLPIVLLIVFILLAILAIIIWFWSS